ncbi:hypothetical protein NXH65_01420, partial [Bacteroides caccae]|nr:hypothetical protein [Bacteroides caccae]
TKMYLCHSENLMPKDTKSLGNNKAPACESRGFVLKKKKVRILTHLHFVMNSVEETNFLLTNLFPDEQFPVHPLCILLPLKVLFLRYLRQ